MSSLAAELARLSATNFFADKPADQSKSVYLYYVALREAQRWGIEDPLANYYIGLSAYARSVGS